MEISFVLNAVRNNYLKVTSLNCENKMSVIKMDINVLNAYHNY